MTNKLYKSGGYLKVNLIKDALINAKDEGKLPNVRTEKIRYAVEAFEEKMEELKSKVGTQITQKEVKLLLKSLLLEKHDKVLDSEWRVIEEILLDKDFDLD
ncbi:hypothetical protein KAK05_03790 [Candidatus Parcubacteria bacterium]|nr:hypothetical protein [Candidatus Parcubacteria bacterium]